MTTAIRFTVRTADSEITLNLKRNSSSSQSSRTGLEKEKAGTDQLFLAFNISSTVSSMLIFSVSTFHPFSFSLYRISVVTGAFR